MIEKGNFLLKDINYEVTGSLASAAKEDGSIVLALHVSARTEDEKVDYDMESLSLYHNDGFCTYAASLPDLKGKRFVWKSHYNKDEEAAGFLCVQEHEEVTRSKIEILNVNGNLLTIHWSGKANVFWNRKYGKNVPFETVFDVALHQVKYRINAYKSLSTVVDEDTRIELCKEDVEALNNELLLYEEQHKKDRNTELQINTILRFTVTHKDREYVGTITFIEGKNKHKTDLDKSCPIRVTFDGFGWNFRVKEEKFWFVAELPRFD